MFIEEWLILILLVVFASGLLIGVNIGIICGKKCGFYTNDVEIPQYVLRPPQQQGYASENFTMRMPNNMSNMNMSSMPIRQTYAKQRNRFNY